MNNKNILNKNELLKYLNIKLGYSMYNSWRGYKLKRKYHHLF